MAGPIDAVVAIHNAFRADIAGIDAAALAVARGDPGRVAKVERFRFFNEVLAWQWRRRVPGPRSGSPARPQRRATHAG